MRISDWSSDVCSSDLLVDRTGPADVVRQVCLEGFDERRIHARGIVGRGQFLQRPDQSHGDETAAVAAEAAAGMRPGVVVDRRSEERRVGKEGVRQGRYRGWRYE